MLKVDDRTVDELDKTFNSIEDQLHRIIFIVVSKHPQTFNSIEDQHMCIKAIQQGERLPLSTLLKINSKTCLKILLEM